MIRLHVLSGDSLLEPFRASGIEGDVAVFRECLVDGPVSAGALEELFEERQNFLQDSKEDPDFYQNEVRREIEKILHSDPETELFLWFEHELFCQVNLWFLLSEMEGRRIFIVSPPSEPFENRFDGWARLSGDDLAARFESRSLVSEDDARLGAELWRAFRDHDGDQLRELSGRESEVFRCLPEVAKAAAEIGRRPAEALRAIREQGILSFAEAFTTFSEAEPAYGFGDTQVKRIWDNVNSS